MYPHGQTPNLLFEPSFPDRGSVPAYQYADLVNASRQPRPPSPRTQRHYFFPLKEHTQVRHLTLPSHSDEPSKIIPHFPDLWTAFSATPLLLSTAFTSEITHVDRSQKRTSL